MAVMNSPLTELHQQAQAEMQPYFDGEIVSTYGRLPLEYAALFRSVGLMDCWHRSIIEVTGDDRLTFLNSVLTCELADRTGSRRAAPGEGRFSFLLDRKGRVQSEMTVLVLPDRCLLELDARLADRTATELEKYHFREKVTIKPLVGLVAPLTLFGPAAARLLEAIDGPKAGELAPLTCREFALLDTQTVVWRDDLADSPGHHLLIPAGKAVDLWQALIAHPAAKVTPIGWAAYNAVRIEANRPLLGIDYDDTFLPAETGQLDRAVSFTKGCYPGQEIVARMESHAQRARQVAPLELDSDTLPLAGEKILDLVGNEVGVITSSTISPRLSNRALCLGILKKGFFAPATELRVPAEGQIRPIRVRK